MPAHRKRGSCGADVDRSVKRLLSLDPLLQPYAGVIRRRIAGIDAAERRLTGDRVSLADFASGHEYFGLHRRGRAWVLREWAPNATRLFLVGDLTGWAEKPQFALKRKMRCTTASSTG